MQNRKARFTFVVIASVTIGMIFQPAKAQSHNEREDNAAVTASPKMPSRPVTSSPQIKCGKPGHDGLAGKVGHSAKGGKGGKAGSAGACAG